MKRELREAGRIALNAAARRPSTTPNGEDPIQPYAVVVYPFDSGGIYCLMIYDTYNNLDLLAEKLK